ncbi:MAG: TIR domain-containing protein [Acetivibrionales bacterium]|jgi:hypothetical protein
MMYRTKTYIAADWDTDKNAVEQLHKWNDGRKWSLSFNDAHDLTQARDSSLNCNIKRSLSTRMDASKTFVLIVGNNTKTVRNGSCQYCGSYNNWTQSCAKGYSIDYRSYIEFECEKAVKDGLNIIVLYYAATVDKSKCPNAIKGHGIHRKMCKYENGTYYWDYESVRGAFDYYK